LWRGAEHEERGGGYRGEKKETMEETNTNKEAKRITENVYFIFSILSLSLLFMAWSETDKIQGR
jgi:preprotein translocase subunit SecG